MRTLLLASLLAVTALPAAAAAAAAGPGRVEGRVELAVEGLAPTDVWPLVAYLERADGRAGPVPEQPAVLRQDHARFDPGFMIVTAGQRIDMPNEDAIYHNVFSYSRPNDFDLGIYPRGESRSVRLEHPGFVEVYCSIHENMNAGILVAPTPWHTIVAGDGSFAIDRVPPGRYRLRVWAWELPETVRPLEVRPDTAASVALTIGAGPGARDSGP